MSSTKWCLLWNKYANEALHMVGVSDVIQHVMAEFYKFFTYCPYFLFFFQKKVLLKKYTF